MARMGKRKQPFYRISVAEKHNPPLGKQIEFIGYYNPKSKELKLDAERAKYWLDQGAQYSRTMGMMLVKEGVLKKDDLPTSFWLEKKRKKRKEAEVKPEETPKVEVEAKTPEPKTEEKPVQAEATPTEVKTEEAPKKETEAKTPEPKTEEKTVEEKKE
ncbi:MAG: 30S ribosomal protein S16 [Patescibacteria group bacterium]